MKNKSSKSNKISLFENFLDPDKVYKKLIIIQYIKKINHFELQI